MSDSLQVSEVFGPTIQGEGPHTGRRCGFLRLALCNLNCSWCDTPYTWDWKGENGKPYDRAQEVRSMLFEDVWAEVAALGVDLLVVTGGEPLVQAGKLGRFLDRFVPYEMSVDVETNGTHSPLDLADFVDHWSVSPKLGNSGVPQASAWRTDVLREFTALAAGDEHSGHTSVAFKFVVREATDLAEIEWLRKECDIPASLVWVMPEGRSTSELDAHLHNAVDAALSLGYNITGRMHVELWGDERGH